MGTIIIGAGIIGLSTAYYLSQSSDTSGSDIHLIEFSPELFASASGQAGGYLQRGQFGRDLASLGDLSFALHEQLALNHDGAATWGYTRTVRMGLDASSETTIEDPKIQAAVASVASTNGRKAAAVPQWLKNSYHHGLTVDSADDAAQIDPKRFCEFLLSACTSRGVHLHHPATVDSVSLDGGGNPTSATISDASGSVNIGCTRILIAAGAWTPRVARTLFPQCPTYLPISPYAGHSLLLRSPRWRSGDEEAVKSGAVALFASDQRVLSCEMFARASGELYLAGVNARDIELPRRPTDRVLDPASVCKLRRIAERLCGLPFRALDDTEKEGGGGEDSLEILRESLCFRPITPLGRPVIDKIDVGVGSGGGGSKAKGHKRGPSLLARHGVWVAAGHGPWGITLGPGTGLVLAELLQGKKPSAEVGLCRVREFANLY